MRTVTNGTAVTKATQEPETSSYDHLARFSETLSDGRTITVREMTGRDLIYMEEELGDFKDTKRSFYLIERLNVGEDKITFDEIADLRIIDINKINELVGKANGVSPESPKS